MRKLEEWLYPKPKDSEFYEKHLFWSSSKDFFTQKTNKYIAYGTRHWAIFDKKISMDFLKVYDMQLRINEAKEADLLRTFNSTTFKMPKIMKNGWHIGWWKTDIKGYEDRYAMSMSVWLNHSKSWSVNLFTFSWLYWKAKEVYGFIDVYLPIAADKNKPILLKCERRMVGAIAQLEEC